MQQQNKSQQDNHNGQNTLIRQETTYQATLAGVAKSRIMSKFGMSEQDWAMYDAEVSIGLLTLRTAFPTQTRNYSDREHDILIALWLEVFAEVTPGLLREAIMRFVSADRKGFFPAPGQVMGYVEDIIAERKRQADAERAERHYAELREHQRRIDSGENCSTCHFCEQREVKKTWNNSEKELGLFCLNPESYKYVGDDGKGYGTVADILCDYYEPKEEDGNNNPSKPNNGSEVILIE